MSEIEAALQELARDRDLFAMAALIGMLASWDRGNSGRVWDERGLAADAFALADAMVRESARQV